MQFDEGNLTRRQRGSLKHWLQRIALLALGGIAASLGASLAAQDFPAKPVRMVVPYPPGGGVDRSEEHTSELQSH